MNRYKNIVLGAGLSGLTIANQLSDCIVIEKNEHVGGTASSFNIDGHVFDNGIHVYNNLDSTFLNQSDFIKKDRKAYIYMDELVEYPYQKGKKKNDDIKSNNYKEFLENSFSEEDCNNFHIPYNEKFWDIDLKKMSSDWTKKPYFPKKDEQGNFGANHVFYYPKNNNFNNLVNKKFDILTCEIVENIDLINKIVYTNKNQYQYDNLFITIPLPELNISFNSNDIKKYDEELKYTLDNIQYTSMYFQHFIFEKEKLRGQYKDCHWLYFHQKEIPFIRLSFPQNIGIINNNEYESIQCEFVNKDCFYSETKNYLWKLGILDDPIYIGSKYLKYAYCIPTEKSINAVNRLKQILGNFNVYLKGRYSEWSNMWMHECTNIVIDENKL